MSIVLDILELLLNTKVRYKGVRVNLLGIPDFGNYHHKSVSNTFYKLHTKGFIYANGRDWTVTKSGRQYFNEHKILPRFPSPFKSNAPRNLLLMFDIPETRKKERHWLRKHLIEFNYFMVQKSVWVGPSPLPEKFSAYIKEVELDQYIKKFKLAKNYSVNKNR